MTNTDPNAEVPDMPELPGSKQKAGHLYSLESEVSVAMAVRVARLGINKRLHGSHLYERLIDEPLLDGNETPEQIEQAYNDLRRQNLWLKTLFRDWADFKDISENVLLTGEIIAEAMRNKWGASYIPANPGQSEEFENLRDHIVRIYRKSEFKSIAKKVKTISLQGMCLFPQYKLTRRTDCAYIAIMAEAGSMFPSLTLEKIALTRIFGTTEETPKGMKMVEYPDTLILDSTNAYVPHAAERTRQKISDFLK